MNLARDVRRVGPLAALLVVCGGCKDDEPARAPQLTNLWVVEVSDTGQTETDLLAPTDAAVKVFAARAAFRAVFDAFLLGTNIESLADAGVMPRSDAARLTWEGAPAGAPAITALTSYNPAGNQLTLARPSVVITPQPGLPSGARVKLELLRNRIVSRTGNLPLTGDQATFTIQTAPFAVAVNVDPGTPVAPEFQVALSFNNIIGAGARQAVSVSAGAQPVMINVVADAQDPTRLVVTPMTGGWQAGTTYTLTVAATAADLFGVQLRAAQTATFQVVAGADGGASDAR